MQNDESVSQRVRYEACFIIFHLACDSTYCTVIIKSNCIEKFLIFIGKEEYTQIQKKAEQVLRKIQRFLAKFNIQPVQLRHQIRFQINETLKKQLKKAKRRSQIIQSIRIAHAAYTGKGLQQKKLGRQFPFVLKIFCEIIQVNFLKQDEKKEQRYVIQGLSAIIKGYQKKPIFACIRKYEILDKLLDYAQDSSPDKQQVRRSAWQILEGFAELQSTLKELVKNGRFLSLARQLIQNYTKNRQILKYVCKILKCMANYKECLNILLSETELLGVLDKYLSKKKILSTKNKDFTSQIIEIFKNIAIKASQDNSTEIIDLIISQNILKAVIKLFYPETQENETLRDKGLKILKKILKLGQSENIGRDKKNRILDELLKLGLSQKLNQLHIQNGPVTTSEFSTKIKAIKERFIRPKSKSSRKRNERRERRAQSN